MKSAHFRKVNIVTSPLSIIDFACCSFERRASRNSALNIPNLCTRRPLENSATEILRSHNSLSPSFWRRASSLYSSLNGRPWVFADSSALRKHDRIVNDVAVCWYARICFPICPCTDATSRSLASKSLLFFLTPKKTRSRVWNKLVVCAGKTRAMILLSPGNRKVHPDRIHQQNTYSSYRIFPGPLNIHSLDTIERAHSSCKLNVGLES
jgi:hypothetical protein